MLKFNKNIIKTPNNLVPIVKEVPNQSGGSHKSKTFPPVKSNNETFRARRRQFLSSKNVEFIESLINA